MVGFFSDIFRQEDIKDEWLQSIREDNTPLYNLLKFALESEGQTSLIYGEKSGWSDETRGRIPNDWWYDIPSINTQSKERVGYPTQKPLALLERIVKASSNEGDIVLDPFCGCATTCVAAERLNRQWIGIDVSQRAYELIKIRLNSEAQAGRVGMDLFADGDDYKIGTSILPSPLLLPKERTVEIKNIPIMNNLTESFALENCTCTISSSKALYKLFCGGYGFFGGGGATGLGNFFHLLAGNSFDLPFCKLIIGLCLGALGILLISFRIKKFYHNYIGRFYHNVFAM